jgi:hypothetical protein
LLYHNLQVRAPMPPTYVFVIDVSFAAASSGMLAAACATIKDTLDSLPGDERTLVAFITFDKCVSEGVQGCVGWGGWVNAWVSGREHAQFSRKSLHSRQPRCHTPQVHARLHHSLTHPTPRHPALPCHPPSPTLCSTIHFYNLKSSLSAPQMMVVPEIDDPFVPLPDDLLVNLRDSRAVVEALLESLPQGYARTGQVCAQRVHGLGQGADSGGVAERSNQALPCLKHGIWCCVLTVSPPPPPGVPAWQVDSAMGPALQAAFLVMNHIGGKLLLFQAAAPSMGIGRIKARDNPALYGTDREYSLRTPDDPFYKRFSAEASRWVE